MTTVAIQKWIEPIKIQNTDCLKFNFSGVLTHNQAIEACVEWTSICKADRNKKFMIIFNAMQMKNYEPLARTTFQKTIKDLQGQISKIWVVTDSKLIASGAAIMGIFTAFPIQCVKSEDHIIAG